MIFGKVALLPGVRLCSCLILSQACSTNGRWHMCTSHTRIKTHAHMHTCRHELSTGFISSCVESCAESSAESSAVGRLWPCLNISFPTAGGCWTCSDHQTSIKVSVCVMRLSSQGEQSGARPASSPPDGLLFEPRGTKGKQVKRDKSTDRNSPKHKTEKSQLELKYT